MVSTPELSLEKGKKRFVHTLQITKKPGGCQICLLCRSLICIQKCLSLCLISPCSSQYQQKETLARAPRQLRIRITRVNPDENDIPLPSYATAGSSGMDLH